MLVREIRSLEIFSGKKEAKLSTSEVTEVEEGKGGEDLRCSNLFKVCQCCAHCASSCSPTNKYTNADKNKPRWRRYRIQKEGLLTQINFFKDISLSRTGKLNFKCNCQSTTTALNTVHNWLSYLTHRHKHHITFSVVLGGKYQDENNKL